MANETTIEGQLVQIALTPEAKKLVEAPTKLPEIHSGFKITDEPDYLRWGEIRKDTNAQIKTFDTERLVITRKLDAAKKGIMDFFDLAILPRRRFLSQLDPALIDYELRIRAEKEKIEREAAEAARRIQQKMLEKAEAKAQKLEEKGDTEGAAAVLNAIPVAPSLVTKPVSMPKVSGLSTVKVWKAKIIAPKLLLEKHPEYFLSEDVLEVITSMLSGIARSTKGTAVIAGVEFYQEAGKRS